MADNVITTQSWISSKTLASCQTAGKENGESSETNAKDNPGSKKVVPKKPHVEIEPIIRY